MGWLNTLVDEAKFAHDINYLGPAYVQAEQAAKQLESEGKTEEAKEIRAAMLDSTIDGAMTAGLGNVVWDAGKALLRKQLMPAIRLGAGMAGGMGGMYAGDKLVHTLSDGKYDTWGDMIQDKTKGVIGSTLAHLSNPLAILGGFVSARGAGKAYAGTKRGKIDVLSGALDGQIENTKLGPSFIDQAAFLGRFGWAPKQTIPYRHGSKQADLKTFVPKHDRWDVVTHGADPYMYFVTDQSTPVSAANMMDRRVYQYTGNIMAEKPMVQIGEIKPAGVKNNSRNQLIARARQQGADAYIMQDIEDNQVPHQNIVARFIGPEGEAVQGGAASIKWYGPTMGKTTAVKTNPNLVDIDPLLKPIRTKHAKRLGLKISDPKVSADPAYKQEVADFILEWRANPENQGKTLVASTKHLLDPQYKVEFANEPSIPDFETFAARNKARGFKETDEQLRAWYNSILEQGRDLNVDNRYVSDIESSTRSANISEAELAGIPKGDRNQAEIIEQLKRQNTANLKQYLSSNSKRIPDNMPNFGPQIGQMKRFLASKVDISQFSDEDILNLIKLRFVELTNSASGRFAMQSGQTTYHLYTEGNKAPIGYVNFGDNGDGTFGVGMVTNYTFGPNTEKGISEDLYNLIINLAKQNGMQGLSSGHDLRSPSATTAIWKKYPNRITLSETGGTHKINGVNTPGPIVLLTEPSKPLVPLKSYLFDPSIIKDGQMIIDWNKGLYRKNGGKLNYLNYFT